MARKLSALIVGCGYLGTFLKELLLKQGWVVDGLRRTKNKTNDDIVVDVGKNFSLNKEYDVVFYMVSADTYTPEAYDISYNRGVKSTLNAIEKYGFKPRFIFVSSTSLFSENQGGVVTEDSPIETNTFSKASLSKGEKLVGSSGLDYCVVRLSGIYGPNRCSLIDRVKSGKAQLKKTCVISNRIHVKDCAGILYHLATIKDPRNLYIGSDQSPTPYNEILFWLAHQLGVESLKTEEVASFSPHMSNKKCSSKRLIESGYSFLFPNFRVGLLSCL